MSSFLFDHNPNQQQVIQLRPKVGDVVTVYIHVHSLDVQIEKVEDKRFVGQVIRLDTFLPSTVMDEFPDRGDTMSFDVSQIFCLH